MGGIDLKVIQGAYGFTIGTDGELYGLVAGDMGYEQTGIKLDDVSLEIWTLGLKAWKEKHETHNVDFSGSTPLYGGESAGK